MAAAILEWLAFIASVCSVFYYGSSKRGGAVIGIITSFLFIAWGLIANVPAGILANIFFIGLHARNLLMALKEVPGIVSAKVVSTEVVSVEKETSL